MPARLRYVVATLTGALALGSACIPGAGPALLVDQDAAAPPPVDLNGDSGATALDVDLGDAFGLAGLVPSHGPWTGGTRAVVNGRGFSSRLRVWIGGTEIAQSAIFASDPTRAAIETPAGAPGPAEVRIRDDASGLERTLAAGFLYDALVVVPNQGATTGGTRVSISGSGTGFAAGSTVAFGGTPCTDVAVKSATEIQCTTPAGSPGVKDVTVTSPLGASIQARDAFTYADTPDGYRGGLAGGALAGTLRVLAYDAWTGTPIPNAYAFAGALTATTNAGGIAQFQDPSLTKSVTVTVAAKCHQPMTFAADPVDTVTAYLTPQLDLSCATGDPPSSGGGGGGSGAGEIDGQLVFPGVEFQPGAWSVPKPTKSTERQVAYVFSGTGSPGDGFYLPSPSNGVTPATVGSHGYPYTFAIGPGNATIYALAGIEDSALGARTFVPYAMGVARGIQVQPAAHVLDVDIPMTTLLDHQVTLAPTPPAPGPRGPDHLESHVAVTLGQVAYAVFPNGVQTSLLPLSGEQRFVGLPALDATLTSEQYVVTARAASGAQSSAPASVVGQVRTTDSNGVVGIGGFLSPPVMSEPANGTWSGTHVDVGVTGTVDLVLMQITSGGGLVTWTIAAPGSTTSFDLPDLRSLAGKVGLVAGPITSTVWVARIDSFSYATLRSGQLGTGAWNAYAYDTLTGAY